MTDATNTISLVLELFTWVGFVPGIVLLAAGYLRKALASRYLETWGVIIPSPAGTDHLWFRWMDLERELQSAPAPPDEDHPVGLGDEVLVYFEARRPSRARLDDPRTEGRLLRVLGWVLASVGLVAAIGQIVILLLPGTQE